MKKVTRGACIPDEILLADGKERTRKALVPFRNVESEPFHGSRWSSSLKSGLIRPGTLLRSLVLSIYLLYWILLMDIG